MSHLEVVGLHVSPPHHLEANQLALISTAIAVLGDGVSASRSRWQLVYCWMRMLLQKRGSDTDAQQAVPRAMDAHPQPWELVPWLLDKPKASQCSPQYPTDFLKCCFYLMNWKEIC